MSEHRLSAFPPDAARPRSAPWIYIMMFCFLAQLRSNQCTIGVFNILASYRLHTREIETWNIILNPYLSLSSDASTDTPSSPLRFLNFQLHHRRTSTAPAFASPRLHNAQICHLLHQHCVGASVSLATCSCTVINHLGDPIFGMECRPDTRPFLKILICLCLPQFYCAWKCAMSHSHTFTSISDDFNVGPLCLQPRFSALTPVNRVEQPLIGLNPT